LVSPACKLILWRHHAGHRNCRWLLCPQLGTTRCSRLGNCARNYCRCAGWHGRRSQAVPQAIEYYSKALAIEPKNPDVLTNLGTAYWYTGDLDKALAEFDKSLAIRPNHPGTLFNVGIVKWQGKKDPKGAVVVWEQLLKTNPNYDQNQEVQMLIDRAKMHGAGATKG